MIKFSRSAIEQYINCKRCFILTYKYKLRLPSFPFTLNSAVDNLCKNEFDYYRKKKEPHPLFEEHNIDAIPFAHEDLNKWRNNFQGISYTDNATGVHFYGAVDDVWFNLDTQEIVVCDYKAQSTSYEVEREYYLNGVYHQGYKMQMDIYVYILKQMNFKVSNISYFMVCNAIKSAERFDAKMNFDIKLIDYEVNTDWIKEKILDMKRIMDSNEIPERTAHCENCAYLAQGSKLSS